MEVGQFKPEVAKVEPKVDKGDEVTIDWMTGTYIGEVSNAVPHGQGTLTKSDGSKYEGQFKNGELHGMGVYMLADGSRYVGEWDSSPEFLERSLRPGVLVREPRFGFLYDEDDYVWEYFWNGAPCWQCEKNGGEDIRAVLEANALASALAQSGEGICYGKDGDSSICSRCNEASVGGD